MGFCLSPVRGFYCQAQRLANVFTEYLRVEIGATSAPLFPLPSLRVVLLSHFCFLLSQFQLFPPAFSFSECLSSVLRPLSSVLRPPSSDFSISAFQLVSFSECPSSAPRPPSSVLRPPSSALRPPSSDLASGGQWLHITRV